MRKSGKKIQIETDVPVISGYFDESGHSSHTDHVSIAAFVGSEEEWTRFDVQWIQLLKANGAAYLHMREFAHYQGEFTDWTESRRRALLGGAIEVINGHDLVAVGAVMSVSDFRSLPPEAQFAFQGPFFSCLQETAYGLALHAIGERAGVRCNAYFSQQDEFSGMMRKLWEALKQREHPFSVLDELRFVHMRSSPGLQAADVLAYELRHFYHQRSTNPESKSRWPFRQIVLSQRHRVKVEMLKNLPLWYLHLQASSNFEEVMTQMLRDPAAFEQQLSELLPRL